VFYYSAAGQRYEGEWVEGMKLVFFFFFYSLSLKQSFPFKYLTGVLKCGVLQQIEPNEQDGTVSNHHQLPKVCCH
jgi:hypothetical protein